MKNENCKVSPGLAPGSNDSTVALRRLLRFALWSEAAYLCRPDVGDLFARRAAIRQRTALTSEYVDTDESAIDVKAVGKKRPGRKRKVVSAEHSFHYGEFFSKKLERSVQYKSELERIVFDLLENSRDVVWYLEEPVSVKYQNEREAAFYSPDVLVCLGPESFAVMEIRPVSQMLAYSKIDRYLALRGYCRAVGWGLLLTNGKYAFPELAEHKLRPDYVAALRARLQHGPISFCEYKAIEENYGASQLDFAAALIQQDLAYTPRPFSLAQRLDLEHVCGPASLLPCRVP